ncbi:nuclear transport factor 2 family protein [Mycobacterium sp. URHB0044]|jgi:ketosteroid isomerase-like protein|uniref:nuclear transport factor 2 family protein n=1 Tax=Mycobacterium sp. URHB0044 TaxID=1380386 RepID=UPI0004903C26|nr:nuclear transport factor 2 family protein [Mycobacterium sp. URHB0044]
MTTPAERTATDFASAIESGDIDSLNRIYDANFRIWHSFTGATQTRDESMAMLRQICQIGSIKYEILERHVVGGRVIQRHNVHFTSKTGATIVIPAAVFITVDGTRITAIDEYVDGTQSAEVLNLIR